MENSQFQNLPSRKFYEFLQKKMDEKLLTPQKIVEKLEVYQKNPANYFLSLRKGTVSVKIEHILVAQEHFGLEPCDLFHDNGTTTAAEPQALYGQVSELLNVIKSQQQTINSLASGVSERRKNA